jgi:hypothetical protein
VQPVFYFSICALGAASEGVFGSPGISECGWLMEVPWDARGGKTSAASIIFFNQRFWLSKRAVIIHFFTFHSSHYMGCSIIAPLTQAATWAAVS